MFDTLAAARPGSVSCSYTSPDAVRRLAGAPLPPLFDLPYAGERTFQEGLRLVLPYATCASPEFRSSPQVPQQDPMQFAPQQEPQVLPRTSTPSTKNLHRPLQARGSSTLLLRPCARMPPLSHAMAGAIQYKARERLRGATCPFSFTCVNALASVVVTE